MAGLGGFVSYKVRHYGVFSAFVCSSVACTCIIIDKIHSFKLKSNLQKLMQVEGNVFLAKPL